MLGLFQMWGYSIQNIRIPAGQNSTSWSAYLSRLNFFAECHSDANILPCKVTRGNSGRGVNSGRRLLFSGEEGLHFQTWYAWTTTLA